MKKLIFVLALLLMAAPAWAAISLNLEFSEYWSEDDPNFVFTEGILTYDVNGESVPRAFALEVTPEDPNYEIDWIWRIGATDSEQGYWVTPTQIDIGDGEVLDWGPPWSELGEVGIIEVGSLYEDGDDGPPDACELVGIVVLGPNTGDEVCLNITVEALRGGVIDEAGASIDIDPNDSLCLPAGSGVEACGCLGDICDTTTAAGPDGRVDFGDWSKLTTEMQNNGDSGDFFNIGLPAGFECMDICDTTTAAGPDGRVDFGDWSKLTTEMQNNGDSGDFFNVGCPF